MRLHEIIFTDAVPVDGFGPGFFRIGGKVIEGAVLVLPVGVSHWGGYEDTEAMLAAAADIDVLFVGTGADLTLPPTSFREPVLAAGIGVEPMASPAACRTYNILLSEGRRVGLALLPV